MAKKTIKNEPYKELEQEKILKVLKGLSSALSRVKIDYENSEKKFFASGYMDANDMEGANIFFVKDYMIVKYNFPCLIETIKTGKAKDEIEYKFNSFIKLLKKHYQDIMGESVGLKQEGDILVHVRASSWKQVFAMAEARYKISGVTVE